MTKKTEGKKPSNTKSKTTPEMSPVLHKFFIDELKDIYWAEKHLTKALPKMQKAATSKELQKAFADHLEATKTHVQRLEGAFEALGEKAVAKKCEAMEGLVKEGESIIEDTEDGTATRDVGLIMAAQKVEHYEIAAYGSLCTFAKSLGYAQDLALLKETLNEEEMTDEKLSQIAESAVNAEAGEEVESQRS